LYFYIEVTFAAERKDKSGAIIARESHQFSQDIPLIALGEQFIMFVQELLSPNAIDS
jgi:hypothetical protein